MKARFRLINDVVKFSQCSVLTRHKSAGEFLPPLHVGPFFESQL